MLLSPFARVHLRRDRKLGEFPLRQNRAHRAVGIHVADCSLYASEPRISFPQRNAGWNRLDYLRALGQRRILGNQEADDRRVTEIGLGKTLRQRINRVVIALE